MNKPVIVVRLHGVSPESSKKDIEDVMLQYGDVLDIDIGYISKKLLPGVTNGTWTVKMIMKEGKMLPSFVFMKEEGEVWQITHESQVNVCWKCGNEGHIGSRCNQPTITFDALERAQAAAEKEDAVSAETRSWAHVVRSGVATNELQKQEEYLRKQKEAEIRKEDVDAAALAKDAADKADKKASEDQAPVTRLLQGRRLEIIVTIRLL